MLPLPRGAVWQLLFLFCAALYINGVRADGRVVCYYTNWSVYRPGTAKFNPQNINPYLCTHLIYAFGGFTKDNQMKPFDKYQDIEQGGYAKFTGLKTYNKQLKTMIAIGGWNEASSRFSPLVANSERRQKFIKNILKFLRQNHFDGIDLDWEYPAHREGGKPRDRDNYAQFVQELRAEFERESEKTGRPRLLLTMAVPAGIEYIEKGYDIPKLNKYLDWFNLLTYDFHSSHEPSVNHHAPLYSLEEESEYNYDAELNIDYSIKFYLNAGADRDKLVLGIPTYGRSYTLINEESTEIGAPAEAPGEQGDATREKGYLAYYEICQNLKEDPEWTVVQPNPNAMGPYAYRRNQWVGYDDEAIVRKKAQYVVDNGLGGIMFWAIDNDDFRGICTGKPYPLIEAAKDAMLDALGLGINEVSKPSAPQKPSRSRSRENSSSTRNRITTTEHKLTYAERKGSSKRVQPAQQTTRNRQQSTTTTSAPTNFKLTEAEGSSLYIGGRTTTPPPPTTPDPGTDFKCEEEGFFQHPRDCKKYYWCLDSGPSGLGIVAHQFTCPSGLYFNPAADSCDFARNVPCKTKKSTTAAPITSPATTTTARTTSSFNRITAATSRPTTFFRTTPRTTTTTTTEAPEESIEYEEEDDNAPSPFAKPKGFDKDSEEDPKVIKELIELIRKVGGIEELEKHLLRKDDGTIAIKEQSSSSSSSSLTATTPSSISKSLYEKVLSKPNALNSFRNRFTSTSSFRTTKTQTKTQDSTEDEESHESSKDSKSSGASAGFSKYSSVLRGNSRQGPQSEGIDKLSEFDGFLKEKKQYTTIQRNRGVKKTSDDEEDEDISGKLSVESHEEDETVEEVSVKSSRKPFAASTPAYSTIRRTRPTVTTEANEEEEQEEKEVSERKSYSSLNRSRGRGTTTTELPDVTDVTAGSSRYKYLERTRPTRPTTESSNKVTDEEDDDGDNESENQENTVHLKAVNIENTRETQQEITTTNTQRTYASIGRRTTTSTTATPETETTTSAAKTRLTTTTTTATPTTTTSTTETPLTTTTPLTILETTTPESLLITTNIPITTTTNPTTISTTTTSTTKTTTTSLPNGEDVLESLATTTINPNEIGSDNSESLDLTLKINSLLTDSSSSTPNSTPNPTTESGLDTNEQDMDSQLTTTEATISTTTSTTTTTTDSDNLAKTEDKEQEEVNLVSKQRNKTLYTTRTRTTTTTPPTTTTTNSVIETTTTPSPTNAKKTLGVRRQQILLNRSSQTKSTATSSSVTTTDIPTTTTPTTESVNNDFLGTVSSPRPFGFPKRRNRPTNAAGITTTTTEEAVKSNDETLVTRQKTTKLNAAANSQTKVSSENTILSETATVAQEEAAAAVVLTSSQQQEHVQQEESEVTGSTTSTEHLNSKDTKVEHLHKHVVEVNGIEGNNDSLRHDNTVDSINNNNSAPKIRTHTIVQEVDDDDDDPQKLYTWRDARRPTKPTPKKKKLVVTEVTTEERVRQKVSPDHATIVNVVETNEKDSRYSKKQEDIANGTGKYRGKSLESSVESTEENHVDEGHDEEEEGRAFRTYTSINRRRQQTKQSTSGIGEDDSTTGVNGFRVTQVVKSGEESGEESSKSKYNTITRGQSTKTEKVESNSSQESEDGLKTKFKYTTLNRGSQTSASGTLDDHEADEGQTKNTFKYTKITRGQGSQSLGDEEETTTSQVGEHNTIKSEGGVKTKYTIINRGSSTKTVSGTETSSDETGEGNQSKTRINYSQISRGQGSHSAGHEEEEENADKTKFKYSTITRGSSTKTTTGSEEDSTDGSAITSKHKYSTINRQHGAEVDSNNAETEGTTKTTYQYTKITRGQGQAGSEEADDDSTVTSKHKYATINRQHGTEGSSESDDANQTKTTFQYTKITRGQSKYNEDTEDGNDKTKTYSTVNRNRGSSIDYDSSETDSAKKSYTTISRTRGSAASTTENIPYKAIVRDSQGVHLTEGELSGFVKHAGDEAVTEAAKRTYLTISRGGQIIEHNHNEETEEEHNTLNEMETLSLTQIEKSNQHQETDESTNSQASGKKIVSTTFEGDSSQGGEGGSKTTFKYSTITRGSSSTGLQSDNDEVKSGENNSFQGGEAGSKSTFKYSTITRGSTSASADSGLQSDNKEVKSGQSDSSQESESSSKTKFKYSTITRGSTSATVSGSQAENNEFVAEEEQTSVTEAEPTTTTTEKITTTTTEATTTTTELPTTTTEKELSSSTEEVIIETTTEFIAPETTTTTQEPTTRRSFFKNRGTTEAITKETETKVEKSTLGSASATNTKQQEQEVTTTQTGRRRVVFRKRPTSITSQTKTSTTTQETVETQQENNDTNAKEISEGNAGSTQTQTSFRRRIVSKRPTDIKQTVIETTEEKLKYDRGSLLNSATESSVDDVDSTTRPSLPRGTYRPKEKGDLSSLLALDLAKKYGNNSQQQFGNGKRRRPVIRHQTAEENEEAGFTRTRITGSTAEETSNDGGSKTIVTKKRIFHSKTSGSGTDGNEEDVVTRTRTSGSTAEDANNNGGSKTIVTKKRIFHSKTSGTDGNEEDIVTRTRISGSTSEGFDTDSETNNAGGSSTVVTKKRIFSSKTSGSGADSTDETEGDNVSRTRITGSTSEESNSETSNAGGSKTIITKKRIFSSSGGIDGSETSESSESKTRGSSLKGDTETLVEESRSKTSLEGGNGDSSSSLASDLSNKQGSKSQFGFANGAKRISGVQSSSQTGSGNEEGSKTRFNSATNQQTSTVTETVNGRRRTIIRKRIQTNKFAGGNGNALGSKSTLSTTNQEGNAETVLKHSEHNESELSSATDSKLNSNTSGNESSTSEGTAASSETSNESISQTLTTTDENSSGSSKSRFNLSTKQSSAGTLNANKYNSLNRKNIVANKRLTGNQSTQNSKSKNRFTETETETIETVEEVSEEDQNSENNNISATSGSKFKSRNSLSSQSQENSRRSNIGSRRESLNRRQQNRPSKTEEVEILEDGSKRIKTIFYETINTGGKIKTIKRTKIKTIIRQAPEYEDIEDDPLTTTTRRPIPLNRGSARFQSNDLSSLLALDFASKSNRREGDTTGSKSRRKLIRKPVIVKEEEHVEEFEEDLPTRPPKTSSIIESTQTINRRTKPLRTITRTSQTAEESNEEEEKEEEEKVENVVSTTRRNFAFKRPTSTTARPTTRTSVVKETVEEVDSTTRRAFAFKRPGGSGKTVTTTTTEEISENDSTTKKGFAFKRPGGSVKTVTTTTTTTEEISEDGATGKRTFAFKRPGGSVKTVTTTTEEISGDNSATKSSFAFKKPASSSKTTTTTTEEITKTSVTQNEQGNGSFKRFKSKTGKAADELSTNTNEPITTETSTFETTTPKATTEQYVETTTASHEEHESLNHLQNQLAHAVENFKSETEKVTQTEVMDALETKNEITSGLTKGLDLSLPIYHRRKYYQYYKDSPIIHIDPITVAPKTSVETNVDIAKQIHEVFNVSSDHIQPEAELSDEVLAIKAMEQAQEINKELSHFLLKTPGSN